MTIISHLNSFSYKIIYMIILLLLIHIIKQKLNSDKYVFKINILSLFFHKTAYSTES